MPSNHLILCCTLLLLPPVLARIRVFSNESVLCIRQPNYWSFSISPFNEYSGLISFRMDWLDLLAVQRTLKTPPTPQFKNINSLALSFLYGPTLTSIHYYWKNHSFDQMDLCWQSNVSALKLNFQSAKNLKNFLLSCDVQLSCLSLSYLKHRINIFPLHNARYTAETPYFLQNEKHQNKAIYKYFFLILGVNEVFLEMQAIKRLQPAYF